MTLAQARRILGKLAKDVSDDDLASDIRTAELLKDLFFSIQVPRQNITD